MNMAESKRPLCAEELVLGPSGVAVVSFFRLFGDGRVFWMPRNLFLAKMDKCRMAARFECTCWGMRSAGVFRTLGVALALMASVSFAATIKGPFQNTIRSSLPSAGHFYIVNSSGRPFDLLVNCLTMTTDNQAAGSADNVRNAFPRMLVCIYDADEYLIRREQITSPEQAQKERLPDRIKVRIPASARGVVQVTVISGCPATYDLKTESPLPLGMMSSVQAITPPKEGIENGCVYIPKGAKELRLDPVKCKVTLWDENNKVVFGENSKSPVVIHSADVVWRISIQPQSWPGAKVLTKGFPVIVCPDKASAESIRGSYEQLDDGTVVAHKFQVRLDRLVRRQFANAAGFQLPPIKSFVALTPAFLSNPEKYGMLLTGYLPVLRNHNFWIHRQVLDPRSPYFGAVHGAGYNAIKPAHCLKYVIPGSPFNPGNSLDEMPPTPPSAFNEMAFNDWGVTYSACGSSVFAVPGLMGRIYNLEKAINPYYHNTNLLNRVIVAATRDLMLLQESDVVQFSGEPVDWPGIFGFDFEFAQTAAYGEVGQACRSLYPAIYREWTEGMQRSADRLSYACAFPPANQSAHLIAGLWRVYNGSNDPYYKQLVEYTLQRFIATMQKPAGYFIEGYGPCTSYNGITLFFLAHLYAETGFPWLKEAIRKNYDLYNHTVAAEPSGRLIGVTDMNHRVLRPWTMSQQGAGREMMRPYLKEAGIWYRTPASKEQKQKIIADIETTARTTPYPLEYYVNNEKAISQVADSYTAAYYKHYNPAVMAGGLFPFEERAPYIRNLGDEFIAVRQPKYYSLIYVGKPGHNSQEGIAPMKEWARTGGGISLLWTPNYHVAMTGQGWNSYAHHGVIADLGNDKVCFASYYDVDFKLDAGARTLEVNGRLQGIPLRYQHRYVFEPGWIDVRTSVEAMGDCETRECYLQFPLFASKERGFKPTVPTQGNTIRVSDNTGAGVSLTFDSQINSSLGHTSEMLISDYQYVIKQLKIELPKRWRKGERSALHYRVLPD